MKANLFLLINGLVIGFMLVRLFLNRKPDVPTPLNSDSSSGKKQALEGDGGSTGERSLNCPFVFNSHSFDAYEVLGVPAGSDFEACSRAVHDLRRNGNIPADFLEAAWSALKSQFS